MTTTGTMKERGLYEEKAKAEMQLLKSRLELLRAKVAKANADARVRLREELDRLEGKKDGLERKMTGAKAVAAEAWDEFRTGVDKARRELADGLEHIAEKLR